MVLNIKSFETKIDNIFRSTPCSDEQPRVKAVVLRVHRDGFERYMELHAAIKLLSEIAAT